MDIIDSREGAIWRSGSGLNGLSAAGEAVEHAADSDDLEALWAWVQTPTGEDDLPAWKRLLGSLAFHDPRRARCAARVKELRRATATDM